MRKVCVCKTKQNKKISLEKLSLTFYEMKETKNLVNKIKSPKKTKLNQNIISARKNSSQILFAL